MTDGPFQPTQLAAITEAEGQNQTRVKYRDWISQTLSSEFGSAGKPHASLILNDEVVPYNYGLDSGSIQELITHAYYQAVPEEERVDFRGAVVDLLGQRLSEETPEVNGVYALIQVAKRITMPQAATTLVDALVTSENVRSNTGLKNRIHQAVWWLTFQELEEEHREEARVALQRLMDHPVFNENWLYSGIDALLRSDPSSVETVIAKYGDRITAFKRKRSKNKNHLAGLKDTSKFLLMYLKSSSVKLTPEQLAILQI